MSVYCKLQISGNPVQNSAKSFTDSALKVVNASHLKQYKNLLNDNFQRYIFQYMRRSGMENVDDLEKSFFFDITGNSLVFGNTQPLIANRYEYGWEDDDDYNEDDYLIGTSPRYYIRPAIKRITDDIAEILLKDAYQEYEKESQHAGDSQLIWESNEKSYFNKYSDIL